MPDAREFRWLSLAEIKSGRIDGANLRDGVGDDAANGLNGTRDARESLFGDRCSRASYFLVRSAVAKVPAPSWLEHFQEKPALGIDPRVGTGFASENVTNARKRPTTRKGNIGGINPMRGSPLTSYERSRPTDGDGSMTTTKLSTALVAALVVFASDAPADIVRHSTIPASLLGKWAPSEECGNAAESIVLSSNSYPDERTL